MGNKNKDLAERIRLAHPKDAFERKHQKTMEERLQELKHEGLPPSAARKKFQKEAEAAAREERDACAEPPPLYKAQEAMRKVREANAK